MSNYEDDPVEDEKESKELNENNDRCGVCKKEFLDCYCGENASS